MFSQPVPVRLYHVGEQLTVEWADIAGTDASLPFLADRISRAGPVWQAQLPPTGGVSEPAALIFHSGRCGSTLVSRSLSLLPRCHIISEPQALNNVLSVDGRWPFLPPLVRRATLRRVVDALARSARPEQDRFILKMSSWSALHLPMLEEEFPFVPKLFVYRRPEEILVSLRESPSGWMKRLDNRMQASLFLGVPPSQVSCSQLGFAAQVLRKIFAQVAESVIGSGASKWLLVPYETLPGALTERILPWLGLAAPDAICRVTGKYSKDAAGRHFFRSDSHRKRSAITQDLAELARGELTETFNKLQALAFR